MVSQWHMVTYHQSTEDIPIYISVLGQLSDGAKIVSVSGDCGILKGDDQVSTIKKQVGMDLEEFNC